MKNYQDLLEALALISLIPISGIVFHWLYVSFGETVIFGFYQWLHSI